jgi:SagB-type dehydrogenase family enzyme
MAPKFASPLVFEDCLEFHSKTCIDTSEKVSDLSAHAESERDIYRKFELSETPLLLASSKSNVDIPRQADIYELLRKGSCRKFKEGSVSFETFSRFISCAFMTRNLAGHRNYPSAGGLFVIEIFLCPLHLESFYLEKMVYHVLPKSRVLEPLVKLSGGRLMKVLKCGNMEIGKPAFVLIYAINIQRALMKYRYRGYRHALIEVGSILQQADLVGNYVGLATLPWSSFGDYEICKVLELNPRAFMPIAAQFIGGRGGES